MASTRQAFVWVFVGKTGSGKTSTAIEMAKYWKVSNPGKTIIGFDPHGDLEDAGLLDLFIREDDDNWAEILMTEVCCSCNKIKHPLKENCTKCGGNKWRYKFHGCLLILDDYRSLITPDTIPKNVLRLFALKRKLGLDIILIVHNPKLIHVRIVIYVKNYFIFSTESSAGDFSDRIPKYVPLQKSANIINQYVLDLGGVDSEKYRDMHPNFPHIMVSDANDELNLYNIDENILNKIKMEDKF